MKRFVRILALVLPVFIAGTVLLVCHRESEDKRIAGVVVENPAAVQLYWKDDKGEILRNIGRLKTFLDSKGKRLKFAMNGGMFMENNAPLGLFIDQQKTIAPLNKRTGEGNFYLQPNGVFYITTGNKAFVRRTKDFASSKNIKWATQSGPMLVINGRIHSAFREGSTNRQIRNGVGILPHNRLLFAMATQPVNLYDFAEYFRKRGCSNALYLDGYVSRMYAPEKNYEQLDGDFGVMIGITD